MKQIQNALELYYADNGNYPPLSGVHWYNNGSELAGVLHQNFHTALASYIPQLPTDPVTGGNGFNYYYDSSCRGDEPNKCQMYGLMFKVESPGMKQKAIEDAGSYVVYDKSNGEFLEIGEQPRYCAEKYTGSGARWFVDTIYTPCLGGN